MKTVDSLQLVVCMVSTTYYRVALNILNAPQYVCDGVVVPWVPDHSLWAVDLGPFSRTFCFIFICLLLFIVFLLLH